MSKNTDLANRLAAMRLKAKEASTPEPVVKQESKPVPAPEAKEKVPVTVKPKQAPALKVVPTRKVITPKQGRGDPKPKVLPTGELERTTITLKTSDTEALSDLQTFLMKRVRKASSTSTLIRLALSYTKQALSTDADALTKAYQQILHEDGRRKSATV
jgi:hypothetical protein